MVVCSYNNATGQTTFGSVQSKKYTYLEQITQIRDIQRRYEIDVMEKELFKYK